MVTNKEYETFEEETNKLVEKYNRESFERAVEGLKKALVKANINFNQNISADIIEENKK